MNWDGQERRANVKEMSEKITVMENEAGHTEELLRSYIEETKKYREANNAKLDALQAEITRYKGFIGGVLFLLSAVWGAIAVFKNWIKIGT